MRGGLHFRGFVERGEDPETAVLRELSEETGIEGSNPELFAVRETQTEIQESISSLFSTGSESMRAPFPWLGMMPEMLNG